MDDGLKDVLSIAAEGGSRATARPSAPRAPVPLRAVAPADAPTGTGSQDSEMLQLGRGGLRQAFWLCGFHEVLREREKKGEILTEREQSLLTLSQTDFLTIRNAVIGLAMQHLDAVVRGPSILLETGEQQSVTELFTVETLRNLVVHGRQAMHDAGPDAALSLFGGGEHTIEPLAIFQQVFSAAIGLVETFARSTQAGSGVLARLSDALDAEIGRI